MRELYFDLWPGDDIKGTATGELTQAYDRKYRKVHLGVDLGTFTINIEDSQWVWLNGTVEPLIRVRRVAGGPFAYDDARYKGAFFAEIAEVTTLAVAEEVDTVAKVSGRGLEAILDRAVINEVATHPDDVGDIYTATVPLDGMWHIDGEVVEAGTHGAVMRIFLRNAETQTPEPMPELTHDFTTIHDSNGAAWDFTTAKWAYPVAMELGDVLAELVQSGMHYDLTPDVVLHAYKDSQAVDRSASVTIAAGKSLDKGNVAGPAGYALVRGPGKSRVLVVGDREADGTKVFQWVADTGLEGDIGVRQGGAHYEATPTTGVLSAFGEKYLADRALLYSGIPAIPYVETEGNEALLDFDVGDILALDIPGLPATAPVKAVTLVQIENGDADPVIEFEDIAWNAERQDGRQPIGRSTGGGQPPPLPPWEPPSGPNCTAASYAETAAAGASIGGHGHWLAAARPVCQGAAMRVTGTFEILPSPGFPFTEASSLNLMVADPFDGVTDYFSGSHPGATELDPGGPWNTPYIGSFDKVTAKRPSVPVWAWIDYADLGTLDWELAAFDDVLSPIEASEYRLWRNGQWSPAIEANYDVAWLNPATALPPVFGSPILYQTTHEVVTGAALATTMTSNYPYVAGSFVAEYNGVRVTPTLVDPDAGEFTLPIDTTGGEVLITYQVASATGTGSTNTVGGGTGGGTIPYGLLGSGGDGSGDNVLHDDGTWAPTADGVDVTDGTTTVMAATDIEFDPADFAVAEGGGGLAQVSFIGTAVAAITVEKDGETPVTGVDHLVLQASGDATVDVVDDGGGQVTITVGATGGGGAAAVPVSQGVFNGTAISSLTIAAVPTGKTIFVFCDGFNSGDPSSITCTNVTFTKIVGSITGAGGAKFSLWAGSVSGTSGTTITITHPNSFMSAGAIVVDGAWDTSGVVQSTSATGAGNRTATLSGVSSSNLLVVAAGPDDTNAGASLADGYPLPGPTWVGTRSVNFTPMMAAYGTAAVASVIAARTGGGNICVVMAEIAP